MVTVVSVSEVKARGERERESARDVLAREQPITWAGKRGERGEKKRQIPFVVFLVLYLLPLRALCH